jgi:hypothetical protein
MVLLFVTFYGQYIGSSFGSIKSPRTIAKMINHSQKLMKYDFHGKYTHDGKKYKCSISEVQLSREVLENDKIS